MDGTTLLQYGQEGLGGIAAADQKFFYDCMDNAAVDFVRQTYCLKDEVVITTVEDGQNYDLPRNFITLYLKNQNRRLVGKYSDGTTTRFPVCTSYEKIFCGDETDSKDWPDRFGIIDKKDKSDPVEGTADAAGAASGGECVLQDDSATFTNTVSVRDIVHNKTDGSSGVVLAVTDDTHLKIALFGGTDNDISESDAYLIIPKINYQVVLEAPAETAGYTLVLPYICMPDPVYSDYGFWRIPSRSCRAICFEAAFLYKVDYDFDAKRDAHLRALFMEEIKQLKIEKARHVLQGGRYLFRG